VIDRVGPGSHYLADDHTFLHMRTEHYYPSGVMNRQGRGEWAAEGGKDARTRAIGIARELLETHLADPIDPRVNSWVQDQFSDTLLHYKTYQPQEQL
jgi:trimethylamine--corrinoid protein Co-methyltransferase